MSDNADRRPLKTRQQAWARRFARFFVQQGVTPNQISLASVGLALLGAGAYWGSNTERPLLRLILLLLAALCIQLRLLSNMLDGLMAVEEGKKTPTGGIYNELPDRIADVIFLVAAGYAAGWPELGWIASLLALLTAYVRALGASFGFKQDFCGPMAKPHRMFTLTVGSVLSAFLPSLPILAITMGVIILGSALTIMRRTFHLNRNLSGHHDN
ncbi:MAG TPA: CDP-alcohol phosphatidyltransferase family protein [Burkholderiales bacterium]|nr:CDP-alcohol phosphatidyltransferase family protein [Burkholderiales bacterium]